VEEKVIVVRSEADRERIREFEAEYPHLADTFKNIQEEQYATFAKKMLSYGLGNIGVGSENVQTDEQKYLSAAGIWYRVNDKIQRLKNLVLLRKRNPLEDEPVVDAWKDLSVYGIIAQIVDLGFWKK
jgi:hypothetical protein